MKEIHNVTLNRTGKEPFGFRIIGGKDQGKTFQVIKYQNKSFVYAKKKLKWLYKDVVSYILILF